MVLQIFGIRSVRLIMAAAHAVKTNEMRWTSPLPPSGPQSWTTPNGIPSVPSNHPWDVQYAKTATRAKEEGIGKPSKYFDFPVTSFGTDATVALKRASRASPQHMKPVRTTVSRNVRRPTTNASNAGATPNEILNLQYTSWLIGSRTFYPINRVYYRICYLPGLLSCRALVLSSY